MVKYGLVAVGVLALVGSGVIGTGTATTLKDYVVTGYYKTVGFSEEACYGDYRVQCLEDKHEKLKRIESKLDDAVVEIHGAVAEMREARGEFVGERDAAKSLLREARETLGAGEGANEPPYRYRGETYETRGQLKRQVARLLDEYKLKKGMAEQAEKNVSKLKAKLESLDGTRVKVEAQLRNIPGRIELAKASELVGDYESTMKSIEDTLSEGESAVEKLDRGPVRSAKELMDAEDSQSAEADADVEAFLKDGFEG